MKIFRRTLPYYVALAREQGLPVTGGSNGGGWIRMAATIDFTAETKTSAFLALKDRFGPPPEKGA